MDTLSLELLYVIARINVEVFLAMAKAIPVFARDISGRVGASAEMYAWFGYTYEWTHHCLVVSKFGAKHSPFGPAVFYYDGSVEWWCEDELHREDGPAVVYTNGDFEWLIHGAYSRLDGPALIHHRCGEICTRDWHFRFNDTCKNVVQWRVGGELHRKDYPAVISNDGEYPVQLDDHMLGKREWYRNGVLHNREGPAVIYPDGEVEYWISGHRIRASTWNFMYGGD